MSASHPPPGPPPHDATSTDPQPSRTDSPLSLRHIALKFDNAAPEASALRLVEALDPTWKTEEGPVEFIRFTDGITNTLMKAIKRRAGLSALEVDRNAILLRAYGQGTDVLIDRERELRAHMLLASIGLAPRLLARFDNGLMYAFIPGHVCSHVDLAKPDVYRQVAKRLGEWHSLPIAAITSTPLLDCEEDAQKKRGVAAKPVNGNSNNSNNKNNTRPYPNTWTTMRSWIEVLPRNTDEERQRVKTIETELAWVESKLGHTVFDQKAFVFAQ